MQDLQKYKVHYAGRPQPLTDSQKHKDGSSTRSAQLDIVMRTVDEAIDRLRISLVLPKIFQNYHEVQQLIKDMDEFRPCYKMLSEFIRRREKLCEKRTSPLKDPALVHMIDYFQENHKIYDILPNWKIELDDDEQKLLSAFEMLKEIASHHLRKSSLVEIATERKLHQMYQENQSTKTKIDELKAQLKSQKIKLRWKMLAKNIYLNKYNTDMAAKKLQNHARIQKEIDSCTRQVRHNLKETLQRQKELEDELAMNKTGYEELMKSNAKSERDARDEKNKILLQLQAMLKKYDQVIGEKKCEQLALQAEHNEIDKKIDNFMIIYNAEEAIYKEVVLKREAEEHMKHQHRVILFMMNRAARIIQRYWRAWRRWQRKKSKKFKKDKKKR